MTTAAPGGFALPNAALPAWRAYGDMLASKDAHFGCMFELNRKYERGGRHTLAEIARLQQLLAEHDRCVAAFAQAMRELGASNRASHAALVMALAALNEDVGGPRGAPN